MRQHEMRKAVAGLITLLLLAGCRASKPSEHGFQRTIPATAEAKLTITTNTVITTEEMDHLSITTEPITEAVTMEVPETDPAQPIIESAASASQTSVTSVPETATPSEPVPPPPTESTPSEPKPTKTAPTPQKPAEPAPTKPVPTVLEPTETTHRHNWGSWTQTTAPTCGSAGVETRSCTGCGEKETRSVAATGAHTWRETAPTCTADGNKSCSVCRANGTLPALGHDWVHCEEEGRWQLLVSCYCGAQFKSESEWYTHATASPDLDYADEHAGYEAHEVWIVDKPALDVCSRCGATR